MRESVKTSTFIAAAIALSAAAMLTTPERRSAAIFSETGQIFFPTYTDPRLVKTIEVVDYDEATASARPFQVAFEKGRWILPANYNYVIDVGDRLTKTAGALVELKKEGEAYRPGQLLRAHRVAGYETVENGDWQFLMWDAAAQRPKMPKGSVGFRWANRETGKRLSIMVWESEAAAASAMADVQKRIAVSKHSRPTPASVEKFEVYAIVGAATVIHRYSPTGKSIFFTKPRTSV